LEIPKDPSPRKTKKRGQLALIKGILPGVWLRFRMAGGEKLHFRSERKKKIYTASSAPGELSGKGPGTAAAPQKMGIKGRFTKRDIGGAEAEANP